MIQCLEIALTRLVKVEKQGEMKMIHCFDMALMRLAKIETRAELR